MIEVLYFSGCPNHEPTVALAREVVRELGLEAELREIPVETAEDAELLRFVGSPSIRVNGGTSSPKRVRSKSSRSAAGCTEVPAFRRKNFS